MSREEQGKAKARSMRVQGKVKVRSRQRKHNLNSNNNLMGFDTIEINLVFAKNKMLPEKNFHQKQFSLIKFGKKISPIKIFRQKKNTTN